jgi:UDP-glucuronate decarboxylase
MRPDDGRVVSNFIVSALSGRPLAIYGDGTQTRSFCFVDDLVEGLVRLMQTPHAVTGPINIGNPHEFSMAQLAQLVISMVGNDVGVEYLPLPADDPTQRQPTIDLARDLLEWTPSTELAEGLERTIDYFRRYLGVGPVLDLGELGRFNHQVRTPGDTRMIS